MSVTLFIADLHLDGDRPHIIALFKRFLSEWEGRAESLYILGDLFEYWIGDDHATRVGTEVADALKQFGNAGASIYFLVGNRDFLVGETYAVQAGLSLLHEPVLLTLNGQRTALMHGDALCTDDVAYQQFRAQVRQPEWQQTFLARPIDERLDYARSARRRSRAHTSLQSEAIMDVNQSAVETLMRELDVDVLIHGHTHRPDCHEMTYDHHAVRRLVVGDWYKQGSVLIHCESGFTLESLEASSAD